MSEFIFIFHVKELEESMNPMNIFNTYSIVNSIQYAHLHKKHITLLNWWFVSCASWLIVGGGAFSARNTSSCIFFYFNKFM